MLSNTAMDRKAALAVVRSCWRRNGYLKDRPDRGRTHPTLEARISVAPGRELKRLRLALKAIGVRPGNPFRKSRLMRLPVYGRTAVEALLKAVRERPRRWKSLR